MNKKHPLNQDTQTSDAEVGHATKLAWCLWVTVLQIAPSINLHSYMYSKHGKWMLFENHKLSFYVHSVSGWNTNSYFIIFVHLKLTVLCRWLTAQRYLLSILLTIVKKHKASLVIASKMHRFPFLVYPRIGKLSHRFPFLYLK